MTSPDTPRVLQQFISNHFDPESLGNLCFTLGIDYGSLPGNDQSAKVRALILECNRRYLLAKLLTTLYEVHSASFVQSGLKNTPGYIALLEGQLYAQELRAFDGRNYQQGTSPPYVEPRRSNKRHIIAWIVIVVVIVGLAITILTQSWNSLPNNSTSQTEAETLSLGSIFFIAQVLFSFITLLAALAELSGWNIRELFNTQPVASSTQDFPFYVIHNYELLLNYLFPDPTTPIVPDRAIPFFPRIAKKLDANFLHKGRILIKGRSKTGKSREAVELIGRWLHTGPTILLAMNHVDLRPPYKVPVTLPVRNLVLFLDDVDRYCQDAGGIERLEETVKFFTDLCHNPEELRVIATVRQEHEFWQKLRYEKATPLWSQFELISLPPLQADDAQRLLNGLAQRYQLRIPASVAEDIAYQNDGTFLNLVLSIRSWLVEGLTQVGPEQAAAFAGNLVKTWRNRYERLLAEFSVVGPIYAAINLLQDQDIPLRPALVVDLAAEMGAGRAFHILEGLLHNFRDKIELSPWFDWYRDRRQRRRGIVIIGALFVLIAYGLSYAFLRFVPDNFQLDFFETLITETWAQLLFLSPLILLLLPFVFTLALQWHRNRQKQRVREVIDHLIATEIPLRGHELRPYEAQCEGNGATHAWSPALFRGQGTSNSFRRYMAPKLAAFYWRQARKLREDGEFAPARRFANLANILTPDHPTPSFVLGQLHYDQGNYHQALIEFERSTHWNRTRTSALSMERIAWCHLQLAQYNKAEEAANQALTLLSDLNAALWVRGLARLGQGKFDEGLTDCRQASVMSQEPPPDVEITIENALSTAESREWAEQVKHLLESNRPLLGQRNAVLRSQLRTGLVVLLILLLATVSLFGIPFLAEKIDRDDQFGVQTMNVLLTLYPQSPAFFFQRGVSYRGLGEYELSVEDFNESLRLASEFYYAYRSRGITYRWMGEYEMALADFNKALLLDPEYAAAYNERGITYREMGKYELALADYNKVLQLDLKASEYADVYIIRGNTYREMEEYELALADFDRALQLDFKDSEYDNIYLWRGFIYEEMGEYELALADYNKALQLDLRDGEYADVYLWRGDTYREMGEYDLALADYNEALQLNLRNSEYVDVYLWRGDTYREMGRYDLALTDFDRALQLDLKASDYAYLYRARGITYREIGEYELALADFDRALQLNLRDSEYNSIYMSRSITYGEMGRYDLALTDFNEALQLDLKASEYDNVYINRGNTYREMGEYDLALADYNKGFQLDVKDSDYAYHYWYRGDTYREMGEYDLALAEFNEALQFDLKDSQYADAYIIRGNTYREMGEYELALADYNEALQLNLKASEYDNVYLRRGDTYREMGRYDLALADFDGALQLDLKDSEYDDIYRWRSSTYREMGKYDLALAEFNEALQLNLRDSEYDDIYLWRGDTYREMGEYELALADYSEALQLDLRDSDYDNVYIIRGNTYREIGEYELALADFNKALQLNLKDSEYANVYLWRGDTYREMGEYDLALVDFDEALQLNLRDSDYADVYLSRGNAYREMGEYELALADYSEILQLDLRDGDYDDVYINRGNSYQEMGEYELALADYSEALQLNLRGSEYVNVYINRGISYPEVDEYELALADFNRVLQPDLENNEYYYVYLNRGNTYRAIGEYDLSLFDFGQRLKLEPDFAIAYSRRGLILREQRKLVAARNDWERALKLYETKDDSLAAETVRGWLSELKAILSSCEPMEKDYLAILPNETAKGNVGIKECDGWHFQGTEGRIVTVQLVGNKKESDLNPYLTLFDPDQELLAEDDDSGDDNNSMIVDLTLPSTGTYTIYVQGVNGTAGTYSLTLTENPQ